MFHGPLPPSRDDRSPVAARTRVVRDSLSDARAVFLGRERLDRALELILANIDDISERLPSVRNARRGVDVDSCLEEALVDARKRPELVIALNEECVLGAFERNLRPARLVNERVWIFGEECELSKGRPRRDCREGEQTDATGGKG